MDNSVQGAAAAAKRRATLRPGTASLMSTARRAAFIVRDGCTGGSTR
ncbi:DUF6380 family protein [Streptomyces sp. ME02-8801-2C]